MKRKGKSAEEAAQDYRVECIEFSEVRAACLSHLGPPENLGSSIQKFIAWRKANGLTPDVSRTFNLLYGNPEVTPPQDFRLDLCAQIQAPVQKNDCGVIEICIPAGRCAVLRYVGADEFIDMPIGYLYQNWLRVSGESLRDFPLFFERVHFYPNVPDYEMITDIYLPLL
ncbi:AraC family transcriptional regulator [Teredinibacter franksiae]|uniref:AraC family transcriptional regulator n=1 Tax=Teredinibacter franksiae TaxID=2761453 RepID=UPI00162ACA5C|nr:GyrI-like domain-containing protein [Teredinibacter franksiae]